MQTLNRSKCREGREGNRENCIISREQRLHISYKDDRLGNIDVIARPIIEHNYPAIYANLYLVEKYFEEKSNKGKVRITTGGLITEKKGKLVMELLTSGGLIIDRKTVNDLIMEHIRKAV